MYYYFRSFEEFSNCRYDKRMSMPNAKHKNKTKRNFCRDYVLDYLDKLNPIADKHGTSSGTSDKPVKELPFKGPADFYAEFKSYNSDKKGLTIFPSESTFKRTLQDPSLPCEPLN